MSRAEATQSSSSRATFCRGGRGDDDEGKRGDESEKPVRPPVRVRSVASTRNETKRSLTRRQQVLFPRRGERLGGRRQRRSRVGHVRQRTRERASVRCGRAQSVGECAAKGLHFRTTTTATKCACMPASAGECWSERTPRLSGMRSSRGGQRETRSPFLRLHLHCLRDEDYLFWAVAKPPQEPPDGQTDRLRIAGRKLEKHVKRPLVDLV